MENSNKTDSTNVKTVKHLEELSSAPAEKTSALPEVLLIGDSIRMGYCSCTAKTLSGAAEVRWPEANCANSQNILISLPSWRGLVSSPRVVQFNCGHWDMARWDHDEDPITSIEEYGRNIRKIIKRLRRYFPEAQIVFATTTAMNPNGGVPQNVRTNADIRKYNAVAVAVAESENVPVNDLFKVTENWPESAFADYCHYSDQSNERLGEFVGEFLRKYID